jgi:Putative Flp pilus-assembly TadE/G-like
VFYRRGCRGATRRRGAVAVLVALLLTGLVGLVAIAVEGGLLLDRDRQVQGAADAAALAAATELFVNYPAIEASNFTTYDPQGAAVAAALASAQANGFSSDTSTVTVNIPPKSGPFTGKVAYAEVILTYYQPRFFSQIWGSTPTAVVARAVGRGRWAGSKEGILVLDPSAKYSLNASGTGGVTVTGGANVIVDSSNASAAAATGGGAVTAPDFEITGGYVGTLNGIIHTGVPPSPDPLRYLPVPTMPPNGMMTTVSLGSGNKQYTLTPGTYSNLPTFNQGDVVILQQASANNANGIFYLNGTSFTSNGANIQMDTSTTGGVMIYNNPTSSSNSQGIAIQGNSSGTVNLSALTAGPYTGLLLWQNRTASQQLSIAGSGNFTLEGTFYAANALLKITGGGNATIGSQYISRTLYLGGNGNVTINYTDNGTARLREVMLVE